MWRGSREKSGKIASSLGSEDERVKERHSKVKHRWVQDLARNRKQVGGIVERIRHGQCWLAAHTSSVLAGC